MRCLKVSILTIILFFSSLGALESSVLSGMAELRAPYLTFLRTSEAELLYEKAGYLSPAQGER